MGTTRHFHVVFDVRVLDLNLSNIFSDTNILNWYDYTNVTRDWPTIARQIINSASYERNIMHKIDLFKVKNMEFWAAML
jgi:hypothetical protein